MDPSNSVQIEELANQAVQAVKTTLDPNVSYEQRLLAFEFLEKTKDDASVAMPCGFFLSERDKDPEVRHLGLQFIEDAIRYHWNEISLERKIFLKENIMLFLSNGTQDILSEQMYIKDKISRLIVEMMKREWPQHWPSLLEDLERLAAQGPTQAELVLLVFRRIAEDVATLQNLECSSRRRDLYQALNQHMDALFCFFFDLLEEHYTKYKDNASPDANLKHCKITQTVFSTLSSFAEWVSIIYIQKHQSKLFNSMCHLISDQNIRQHAVECLLLIVSRKGRPEDRKFILSLFSEDMIGAMFSAASLAVADPLNETNYLFLKGLTQVVTTLGSQLCCLWGKEPAVKEPECFSTYLNTLIAFSKHPSLSIYSYTTVLWAQLFRNEAIRKSRTLIDVIPQWLPIAYSKVLKHGFSSKGDDPSCQYTILDFDAEEEYYSFFCKVRTDSCEAIRRATLILPQLLFDFAEEQLLTCLQKDLSTESLQGLQVCWDGVSHIMERIMSQLLIQKKGFNLPRERVERLLLLCFKYKSSNPDVMSLLLTCISGLCVMLPCCPEQVESVLDKLFECLDFTGDLTKGNRTKAIKNARKHAASLLLKLCKNYPALFSPFFREMDHRIVALIQMKNFSQLESVTLLQTLLILNGYVNNYQGQLEYVTELTASMKRDWLSLKDIISSPSVLMTQIGLHQASNDPESDSFGANRSKIFGCIDLILALLNRCQAPSDMKMAEEGGFVISHPQDGPIVRNPITPIIISLLPNIFCLLWTHNGLYLPEYLASLHPDYLKVHNISEEEKHALLGMKNPFAQQGESDTPKTNFQRLQVFVRNFHEHLCLILGSCGPNLGAEFFEFPQLAECLIHSVFWNFHSLPNLKMRFGIRILKPLISSCPKRLHESVLLPLIYHIAPIMLTELQKRWESFSAGETEEAAEEDENMDTDKVVDNVILHALTRDYMDVVSAILMENWNGGNYKEESELNGFSFEEMDTGDVEMNVELKQQPITHQDSVGHLGRMAIGCDVTCQALVLTLLRTLSGPDTVSCRRAIQPLLLSVDSMMKDGHQQLNAEAVHQILMCVLASIHRHGQHSNELELLLDLAVSLYEKLRPHFPVLKEALGSLPEIQMKDVDEFEETLKKLADSGSRKTSKYPKFKRDALKKVVRNIIGRNVGEALKKDSQFTELKPIYREPRPKPRILDETNDELNLCSLFGASVAE